jgi:hypothetical protein
MDTEVSQSQNSSITKGATNMADEDKTIPDRIWLQWCDDDYCEDDFISHIAQGESSWANEKINERDIEYVRALPIICLNCGASKPCELDKTETSGDPDNWPGSPCTFDPTPRQLWDENQRLRKLLMAALTKGQRLCNWGGLCTKDFGHDGVHASPDRIIFGEKGGE